MKEKYEDLKMEVVAFEEDIWTQQGGTPVEGSTKTVTLTGRESATGTR